MLNYEEAYRELAEEYGPAWSRDTKGHVLLGEFCDSGSAKDRAAFLAHLILHYRYDNPAPQDNYLGDGIIEINGEVCYEEFLTA